MWWRCGKGNATRVRCGRWLRPGRESSWQHHSTWTCLDPHTTGLATTLCARSPLGVRSYVHSELSVVVCCVMSCSGMVFAFSLNVCLHYYRLYQVSIPLSSEKALIVDKREIYWGWKFSEGGGLHQYLFISVISFYFRKVPGKS